MSDDEMELGPLLGRGHPVPRRRWRWLLPLLVTLAAAVLLAVAVTSTRNGPDSPARVMDRYLDAVEKGDTTEAYPLLCRQFRSQKSFSEFERTLRLEKFEAGGITEHGPVRIERLADGTAVTSYTVRRQEGDAILDARLIREGGQWRICGFNTRGLATTTTLGP
jgi:hypothetical protein